MPFKVDLCRGKVYLCRGKVDLCRGNDCAVTVMGHHRKGNVWIEVSRDGLYEPDKLGDVLYVPTLAKKLFSVSATAKRGSTMLFDKERCTILNNNKFGLGSGKVNGKLHMLDAYLMNMEIHVADSASSVQKNYSMKGTGISTESV